MCLRCRANDFLFEICFEMTGRCPAKTRNVLQSVGFEVGKYVYMCSFLPLPLFHPGCGEVYIYNYTGTSLINPKSLGPEGVQISEMFGLVKCIWF